MARGPQQGDRYGVWYLESRAKPVDGKRYWNVVNTETDETRVVAQTELKNLETDVQANSAQITERVLIGNGKLDAFSAGDGPDDDSEYPFVVEFTEPESFLVQQPSSPPDNSGTWFTEPENPFDVREFDDPLIYGEGPDNDDFDELAEWAAKQDLGLDESDDCDDIPFECDNCLSACPADENCTIENGKHVIAAEMFNKGLVPALPETESPWDTELRTAVRECMMHLGDARNALDRVLKLVVNP